MTIEMWDGRYTEAASQGETVWRLSHNEWIEQLVDGITPGRAVDLGAGEGRNAIWLATQGWGVTAVDFSAVGIGTGRARALAAGVELDWVVADATTCVAPDLVDLVDLVVIIYLQLPHDGIVAAVRNAIGYLAPGGMLAVLSHDRENMDRGVGGPRIPDILHTVHGLTAAAAGLRIVECRQVERPVEGGVAIDVRLLAVNDA